MSEHSRVVSTLAEAGRLAALAELVGGVGGPDERQD